MRLGGKTALGLMLLAASGAAPAAASGPFISKKAFGRLADSTRVDLYTLTNRRGTEARIMTYGGIVVSLKVPDRTGQLGDVVLGYDDLGGYVKDSPYFGALIGRYGNRIRGGKFTLNGKEYTLAQNNNGNHLHGGVKGFDKVVWRAKPSKNAKAAGLSLSYRSKDGEEGYPGNLNTTVVYTLTDNDELKIDYSASSDKDSVVNLTHHSYFNLRGQGTIGAHLLTIHASRFTPVDQGLIPSGELKSVEGTPFDFRAPTAIGARIEAKDEQIRFGKGYDHNWVLDSQDGALTLAATLTDPVSGRSMDVLTTEPGLQFYSGNFLDGSIHGKGGLAYPFRSGLCLETQHYPDSPHQPAFPSTVLKAGNKYASTTLYRFYVAK